MRACMAAHRRGGVYPMIFLRKPETRNAREIEQTREKRKGEEEKKPAAIFSAHVRDSTRGFG